MIAASSPAFAVFDSSSAPSPKTALSTRLKQGAIASLFSLAMVAGLGDGAILILYILKAPNVSRLMGHLQYFLLEYLAL